MMTSSGNSNINVIVAWNPSNDSQFAASSSSSSSSAGHSSPDSSTDKLHLFSRTNSGPDPLWNREDALQFADNELRIEEIRTWSAPQISCLDWSPALGTSKDSSFIAYGNHIGDVHIINGRHDDMLIHSLGRPCTALAWNKLDPTHLLAGCDNLKSEFSVVLWDFNRERFLKTSANESTCSLAWLTDNAFTFAVGNSMGCIKIYDIRTSSQVPMIPSFLAHGANRPRKLKAIRPDPDNSFTFASFSDSAGDIVKIWDYRKMSSSSSSSSSSSQSSNSKPNTTPILTITPKSIGAPEAIVDALWSPSRPGIIAVATSINRSISFFNTHTSSNTTSVPEYSIPLPGSNPVRSMSWQYQRSQRMGEKERGRGRDPSNTVVAALDAVTISSSTGGRGTYAADLLWEDFKRDTTLRSVHIRPQLHHPSTPSSSTSSSLLSKKGKVACNDLLVATRAGFIELFPKDRLSLAMSSSGRLAFGHGNYPVIGMRRDDIDITTTIDAKMDVSDVMCRRSSAGYSSIAEKNKDVFMDELHELLLYKQRRTTALATETVDADIISGEAIKEGMEAMIANSKAVYRVWVWIGRVEAESTKLPLTKCGVLSILQPSSTIVDESLYPVLGVTTSSVLNISKPSSAIADEPLHEQAHPVLGVTVYHSKSRDSSRRLCGWSSFHAKEKKIEKLVGQCVFDGNSFERAAAIALWHGSVAIAVDCLRKAIENADELDEWDGSVTMSSYLQTMQLVAMCFAGYNSSSLVAAAAAVSKDINTTSRARKEEASSSSSHNSSSSTWTTMCRQVVSQLQQCKARASSAYLVAACRFLLFNLDKPACTHELSLFPYREVLDDDLLSLEDRVAFACTYLPDHHLMDWLKQCQSMSIAEGRIEGLILTGLSPSGMKLLQQYIDLHSDIQTAALIVSRIVEPDSHGFDRAVSSSQASRSDDVIVKDRNLYQAYIWLYEYRQFLNKMELYVERAHLDVELGKQYRSRLEANANSADSINRQSTKQQSTSSGQQPKKRNALNSSSSGSSSKPQIKGSRDVCNAIYRIFDPSNHCFFHLRCTYCAASLPVSVIEKDKRLENLRTQKDILQCCSKCSRQLPRCYVCQLHMSMVNPFLEYERSLNEKRLRSERRINQESSRRLDATGSNSSAMKDLFSDVPNAMKDVYSDDDSLDEDVPVPEGEHHTISFGKWFLFCQHCRHGGHAACIDQWFGGSGRVCLSSALEPGLHDVKGEGGRTTTTITDDDNDDEDEIRKRLVCGVNGCDCRCILRI